MFYVKCQFVLIYVIALLYFVHGGVTGLTKFMRCNYKSSWKNVDTSQSFSFDHVCIDMNQFLYSGLRSTNRKHFISRLYSRLDEVLRVIKPTKSLVFAFDGSAPFAKLVTQRSRRLTSSSSSMITPGTDIMNDMNDIMFCYILQRFNRYHNVTVFLSSADNPGEGELKIIDWIKTKLFPSNNDDTIVIVGSDSDIFIQMLSLQRQNMFIYQTGSEYLDSLCDVTSITNSMVNSILTTIPSSCSHIDSLSLSKSILADLPFIMILQGNDYLPKLRSVTLQKAMSVYVTSMLKLPIEERYIYDRQNKTFNFIALWQFMKVLALNDSLTTTLPVHITNSIEWLYMYAQRDKINITEIEISQTTTNQWSAEFIVNNSKTYSTDKYFSTKKEARMYLADKILQDIDISYYRAFQEQLFRSKVVINNFRLKAREFIHDQYNTSDLLLDINCNDNVLTQQEYYKLVSKDDIEEYLVGVLWNINMYQEGICPDLTYSYSNRPPMTPYIISNYIECSLHTNERYDTLTELLQVKFNETSKAYDDLTLKIATPICKGYLPLSADATALCVIPKVGQDFIPLKLRNIWMHMQSEFFNDTSDGTSYSFDEMTRKLMSICNVLSHSNISNSLHTISHYISLFVNKEECNWAVITSLKSPYLDMMSKGYNGIYKRKVIKPFFNLPFTIPKMPKNVTFLLTSQSILSDTLSRQ